MTALLACCAESATEAERVRTIESTFRNMWVPSSYSRDRHASGPGRTKKKARKREPPGLRSVAEFEKRSRTQRVMQTLPPRECHRRHSCCRNNNSNNRGAGP